MELTLRTVYDALESLLGEDSRIVIKSIIELVVAKEGTLEGQLIPTLGINSKGQLFVSEAFWKKYVTEKRDLQTVLLHELIHQISNDTREILYISKKDKEFRLKLLAHNIAQDTRINAFIHLSDYVPDSVTTFHNIYTDELIEETPILALLCPNKSELIPTERMKSIYNTIYSSSPNIYGYRALYNEVLEWLRENGCPSDEETIILIGDHSENPDDSTNETSKDEPNLIPYDSKSQIKDVVKKALRQKAKTKQNAANGAELAEYLIDEAHGNVKLNINMFKHLAFNNAINNVRLQMHEYQDYSGSSIFMPTIISRSDIFKLIYGFYPVFWKTKESRPKNTLHKIPIYLDVSGSMISSLPEIIDLILGIKQDIEFVWGFSTRVHKHTIDMLDNRRTVSTGGTSFNCVITHALANRFSSIMVITDGYAAASQDLQERCLNDIKNVTTVLTDRYNNPNNFFSQNYQSTLTIEEVTA